MKMSNKIEFYQSPEELPIKRYQRLQKQIMIDSEVGSSFEAFDLRSMEAIEFLRKNMIDEAVKSMENRRQASYNAYTEYSPKHYALALMVKSINGKDYSGKYYLTEDGMNEVLQKLDDIGYTQKELENDLSVVKKKLMMFWKCISRSSLKTTIKRILIYFIKNTLKQT